jgi:signal transduction histidine kinase
MSIADSIIETQIAELNLMYQQSFADLNDVAPSMFYDLSDIDKYTGGTIEFVAELAKAYGIAEHRLYQAIINGVSGIFYVFDDELQMVGWNQRFEEVLRRTTSSIRNTTILDHVSPTAWPELFGAISQIVAGKSHVSVDVPILVDGAPSVRYLLSGNLIPQGNHWYVFGCGLDLGEQEAAERKVERYAAFEHLLSRIAGDLMTISATHAKEGLIRAIEPIARFMKMDMFAICSFDFETQKVRVRASWQNDNLNITQSPIDNLPLNVFPFIRKKLEALDLFVLENLAELTDDMLPFRKMIEPTGIQSMVLVPMSVADKTIGFWALSSAAPRSIDTGDFLSLKTTGQLIANVLQRLDRDSSLKEREAELEATLAARGDGILVLDNSEKVILANRRFSDLFSLPGIPKKGTSAKTISVAIVSLLARKIPTLIFEANSQYEAMTGFEDTLSLSDGRYLKVRRNPFRREGTVSGQVWTFRDITAERNLELQLQQSQKLESIGRLASGIAHDFNNILFSITSICDVRLNKKSVTDRDRKDFGSIKKTAERAATLTRQLLAFSRRQVLSISTVSLNDVVNNMAEMLHRLIRENIIVNLFLNAENDIIRADSHQLEQVILNLVVNARDAMPNGGMLTLETDEFIIDDNSGVQLAALPPGEYVQLRVTDTGEGMDEEIVSRIFDPFFTTKPIGKGTGLGLAMIYGIIKQHGGHISAYSRPGEGTTFNIFLPRGSGELEEAEVRISKIPLERGKGETILLVEDERITRKTTSLMLRSQGYCVLEATNGREALTVMETRKVDLLLTDVIMPELGGIELFNVLHEKEPDLPVVFMSAFFEDNACIQDLLKAGHPFLQKPIHMQILLRALHSALANNG